MVGLEPMSHVARVQTRHGPMLVMRGDTYVGRALELYGECSARETELLLQLVRPGSVVVEAGANIGAHTLPLARACAPGPLYALEPQQRLFQILCANLVENAIHNVIALPEACGASPGFARIPAVDYDLPQNFGSMALLEPGSDLPGRGVRLTSIDELGLARCRLIKADVEGSEAEVLKGARETIRAHRPMLYVENGVAERQQEVISLIHELGYRQWWHTPPIFDPDNWRGNRQNVFPGIVSVNILAIPNEVPGGPPGPPIDPRNWTSPVPPMPLSDFQPKVAQP